MALEVVGGCWCLEGAGGVARICPSRARVRAIIEGAVIRMRSVSMAGVDGVDGVLFCENVGVSETSSDMRRRSEGMVFPSLATARETTFREATLAEGLAGDSTGFDGRWDGGAFPRCACTEANRD